MSVKTGISFYKIDLKALDKAYSIAFPKSTPLNVDKKKKIMLQLLQCCSLKIKNHYSYVTKRNQK